MRKIKSLTQLPKVKETKWRDSIIAQAKSFGWTKRYFTWNSMHSPKGFPDLILLHPELKRCIVAELKLDGKEPTPEQQEWLDTFALIPNIEVFIWHLPADLNEIAEVISGLKVLEVH